MEQPATLAERSDHCAHCMTALELAPMKALVDGLDDAANRLYEAWPDRLYLIDRAGKIAFRSAPGPYGFEPKELEAAIHAELGLAAPEAAPAHE